MPTFPPPAPAGALKGATLKTCLVCGCDIHEYSTPDDLYRFGVCSEACAHIAFNPKVTQVEIDRHLKRVQHHTRERI